MVNEDYKYLQIFVKGLKLLDMWPQTKRNFLTNINQYLVPTLILITTFPIVADITTQFQEGTVSFTTINENFVALSALLGVTYISACFINNKNEIKNLVQDLSNFEKFTSQECIKITDNGVSFYTKLFVGYEIVGNFLYGLLPLLNYEECQKHRSSHMVKYGIPCGLVVRFLMPFKFDYTPLAEIVAIYEILICTLCSTITVVITMLICGVLIHITALLHHLKIQILELDRVSPENLDKKFVFCLKYHIEITNYAKRADVSFDRIMLLHITWTGFVISILGFEITTTTNAVEAVRFAMHLGGWLGLLFIVCYNGQALMDESLAISNTFYNFSWIDTKLEIQKSVVFILAKSQKPLTLKACGLKVMSLATFLGVLYSAYSYFTLLLKLKP